MILLLNPRAAGGTAEKKWNRIEAIVARRFPAYVLHTMNGSDSTYHVISAALASGEREFAAAGGDGTVNSVLNALVVAATGSQAAEIRLGAIGLGSSNDFHKPFANEQFLHGIPGKLEFHRAQHRDVGCISFLQDGRTTHRYFLANASCGVTAEANWYFNNPDPFLGFLKRTCTPAAILSAALRAIFRHKNFPALLESSGIAPWPSRLTNLAVMKSPHVSDCLMYDTPIEEDDGAFIINLSEGMTTVEVLRLLVSLARGRFSHLPKTQTWHQSSLRITAPAPFAVEYDGEVITTHAATFTVLPQYLKVCP